LFIAANCGEQFRHSLATQLDAWRLQLRVSWARPQNWHVTLAFLGDWPAELVNPLQESLRAEAALHSPLRIQPGQLGGFPSLSRPRVLFLHMESDGGLERLAAGIRRRVDEVAPDGPQDRKAFRAHLTVARIKRPLPASQRRLISKIQLLPWQPFTLEDFRLVESKLRPQGALHADLAVFPLGQGG